MSNKNGTLESKSVIESKLYTLSESLELTKETEGLKFTYLIDLKKERGSEKKVKFYFFKYLERYPFSTIKFIANKIVASKPSKVYSDYLKIEGSNKIRFDNYKPKSFREFTEGRIKANINTFFSESFIDGKYKGNYPITRRLNKKGNYEFAIVGFLSRIKA